jgi:predicted RNA-binding protein with PIN domain
MIPRGNRAVVRIFATDSAMRWLIDGYNVMHAGGLLGPRLGREGFRRARRRFLDQLSAALGPAESEQTTVVFDASAHPGDFGLETRYHGLGIVFALGDESADARIEQMIALDANPKTLAVVSSDRRIRQAAARRRARSVPAVEYWERIDELRERKSRPHRPSVSPASDHADDRREPADPESARWLEIFRNIADQDDVKQSLVPLESLLTDAEIEALKREVERES